MTILCNVCVYDFVCRRRECTHTYTHTYIGILLCGNMAHATTMLHTCASAHTHTHTHRLFVVIQSYDVRAVREIAAEHTQLVTQAVCSPTCSMCRQSAPPPVTASLPLCARSFLLS